MVKSAVESPLCACCKEHQRGPRFVAMMESDPKNSCYARFVDNITEGSRCSHSDQHPRRSVP
eukprot:4030322-Prorocentrum_lima.AAC.1